MALEQEWAFVLEKRKEYQKAVKAVDGRRARFAIPSTCALKSNDILGCTQSEHVCLSMEGYPIFVIFIKQNSGGLQPTSDEHVCLSMLPLMSREK